ncbi:MAG: efflux RND transporter periplasmic adaptor subunit [Acidobacteriota bacterium]
MHTVLLRSLSFLGLAFTLTACSYQAPPSVSAASDPSPVAAKPASVAVDENAFTASGPLVVEHQLDLLAQRDGVVSRRTANVGTRFKAGDVLAELDSRQLAADLAASQSRTTGTEAELKSSQSESKVVEADFDRAKKLWDAQLIPFEEFEHAKYKAEQKHFEVQRAEQSLAAAKASQQSLELELEKTRIRAPFAGVVARRYIRDGQQVARGDRLFWITGDGALRMRFTAPERFIGQIRKGLEVNMTTPDLPNQRYRAKVIEVSPVIDPSSSTFEVMVQVENTRTDLRPGMNASVVLTTLQ